MAVAALPSPPTAYVNMQGTSTISAPTPVILVRGRMSTIGAGYLAFTTKTSSPTYLLGTSTTTFGTPLIKMSSATPLLGTSSMTVTAGVTHVQESYSGGFHVDAFGQLDVQVARVLPGTTLRNLMSVSPVMTTPTIVAGKPILPTVVGRTTSPATTAGTYTLQTPPSPSATANVPPVTPTWRWLASDIPGVDGINFTDWPEKSGTGPHWTAYSAFAPTIVTLSHYDTVNKTNVDMGRCVNIYWRYAQHLAMTMDASHTMTTPQPFTMQFVMLAYPMTSLQYQHIFDAGFAVNDGMYTDPVSGTVQLISDAVYQNKTVPINDNLGNNRAYFGLRPNKVETLFNNTPHTARLTSTTTVDSRPLVYTVIFNAGAASKVRIRGYGVNETLAADSKTSVVNNFLLGRTQGRIGSTSGARLAIWEMAYFNRALTEDELGQNSHWFGGVYKFASFR